VTQEVLDAVGKVLAVHLSYSSRAAQRGRTPKFPSYFMKATSSLALSGAQVERPADTELLQFEGEIALVIGTEARRITPQEGWAHVGWITASNDLGIQDIKYADKGSNVRSKSGDGYTPLGPVLLPAADLDPARLRVATKLNGAEVQNATTDELLFSFGQIVADLSQQMTLHPGDVILTGTPAGSSVFAPGDVVTIEVSDAREGGASTGELTTTATQAAEGFKDFGNPTKVTDADRIDAWGDAEAAGLEPAANPLTPEVRAQLEAAAVATLSTSVKKAGVENCTIAGLTATKGTRRVIGVARTLRYVPLRQDLFKQSGGGYNAQKRVIDSLNEGEILVMEARGETGAATMGDILVTRAGVKGAAGIISDGAVRDLSTVEGIDLPVFHSGAHPSVLGRKHIPWDTDITVACGGATVQPGDVIVADSDGIIVIPPALVAQVAADAAAQEAQDAWVLEQVEAGNAIEGLFPPTGEWKAKYEAHKAALADQASTAVGHENGKEEK
jgi:2-keto-4-pentenoate hydratase/2-oxohepta-3-ene-1,7-dioic acid hydratase in catechol pathway/regulator of RNase E activity RraA